MRMIVIAGLLLFLCSGSSAQTVVVGGGGVASGTSLPASCAVGDLYFKSDAAAGQNLYGCSAADTWTLEGGSATTTTVFQGLGQGTANGWNLNWVSLLNVTFGTFDATHQTSTLVVTAATTSSQVWANLRVTGTVSSLTYEAQVSSTDTSNPGSVALAYACLADGDDEDNPSQTSLTALTLASMTATRKTYQTTQSVTCSGTTTAPKVLRLYMTFSAPSGGTLILHRAAAIY